MFSNKLEVIDFARVNSALLVWALGGAGAGLCGTPCPDPYTWQAAGITGGDMRREMNGLAGYDRWNPERNAAKPLIAERSLPERRALARRLSGVVRRRTNAETTPGVQPPGHHVSSLRADPTQIIHLFYAGLIIYLEYGVCPHSSLSRCCSVVWHFRPTSDRSNGWDIPLLADMPFKKLLSLQATLEVHRVDVGVNSTNADAINDKL